MTRHYINWVVFGACDRADKAILALDDQHLSAHTLKIVQLKEPCEYGDQQFPLDNIEGEIFNLCFAHNRGLDSLNALIDVATSMRDQWEQEIKNNDSNS